MRLCVYHLPTKLWPLILETPISCALRPFPQHNISWFAQDKGLTFLGGNLCVSVVSDHKAWLCATSLYSDSVRTVHDSVIPGRNSTVCTRLYVVCLSIFAFDHKPSLKMSFTSYQNSPVPVNNEDFSLKEKSKSLPRLTKYF